MTPTNNPRQNARQRVRHSAARGKIRRRAAAMAAVLVCLLVIMLIGSSLVRGMLLYHRQAKTESVQLQALWLSESAVALAVAQLRADPEYPGQTWRATVNDESGATGVSEITVEHIDEQPRQRVVRVKTTYPDDPVHRAVLEKQITVTLPALGASE